MKTVRAWAVCYIDFVEGAEILETEMEMCIYSDYETALANKGSHKIIEVQIKPIRKKVKR